jgi:drug/metabolite transporter (DMT)-like permease
MMRWMLVAAVVGTATAGEVLQAFAMRRHGEVRAVGPLMSVLVRNRYILASFACLAVSFFAFLSLVSVSDLSFAVPATAASYVLQTILAKYLLKEAISPARWAGASLVACGVALLSL